MKRVPVDVVLSTLAHSGIAANARQIRNWRLRGHITRTHEGYDLCEILSYLTSRGVAS